MENKAGEITQNTTQKQGMENMQGHRCAREYEQS